MATVPIENCVRVEMLYDMNPEIAENVYHVQMPAAVSEADLDDIAGCFSTWEENTASQFRSGAVSLNSIVCTDLTSPGSLRKEYPQNPVIAGNVPGDPAPNNVTWAIRLLTIARGRGTQGRTFWIGFTDSMITGNNVNADIASAIPTALTDLITQVQADTSGVWVVAHTQENGVPLNAGFTTAITGILPKDSIVDSQKSRLPGHRRHKRSAAPTP